jgi:nitronate monooxygenase
MEWKTRVTELFGCKYPILEGAYRGFGTWQFAAAISEAGALGLITAGAGTSRTPERLREDIKKCRDATDKPFAVNLSTCPQIEEMLEICIQEGVPVETAGYKPDALAPRIKEGGVKWTHKATRVRDALHAERLGADAIILVGLEGVGFKNPEQLPTLTTTTWGTREVKVPFISAGGIGDSRGFLGALGMGADGIMMGTAFMATKECPINDAAKEALVRASAGDPRLHNRVIRPPDPEAYAEVMKLRGTIPDREWVRKLHAIRPKGVDTTPQEESSSGARAGGSLAVAVIDRVRTVKEFIDGIIQEAEEILDSWEFLKTR